MIQTFRLLTITPEETQEVGHALGACAKAGDIFLLTGPLGAGKTCLSQGIARGLGVPENLRSPTFVLMTRHQGRLVLHHLDLYRINDPWEAWDLGLDEQLMGDDVCVVEWADKAVELFPADSCWIDLDYGPGESCRTLSITTAAITEAAGRYERLIRCLKAQIGLDADAGSPASGYGGE